MRKKFPLVCGAVAASLAFGLGFAVAWGPAVRAATDLRCSETARAYASGEIGGIEGVRFLKNCVSGRVTAMKAEDAVAGHKPEGPTNPLLCHQYAGEFAVESKAMTAEKLAYLAACVDADLALMEEGT
jgi:hypothetical protein